MDAQSVLIGALLLNDQLAPYSLPELSIEHFRPELQPAFAAVQGFTALKQPCAVTLYSDSAYLVNAFKQNWIDGWQRNGWKTASKKPVENQDLWKWLLTVMQPHQVTIIKVKGHADNPWNNRCDELATGQIRSHRNG